MSIHRVEEWYIHLSVNSDHVVELKDFVGRYEYSNHDHTFDHSDSPSLTIDGFDSLIYAYYAECQILNFIESIGE